MPGEAQHYNDVGLGAGEKRCGGDRKSLLPNRLAAARARSWRRWRRGNNCPAAGPFGPWDVLDRRRDHTVAAENRDCGATSALAITLRSNESRPLALAASERVEVENPTNHPTLAALPWVRGAYVLRGRTVQGEHGVRVY